MKRCLVVFTCVAFSYKFFCGVVVGVFLLCLYLPFTVIGF